MKFHGLPRDMLSLYQLLSIAEQKILLDRLEGCDIPPHLLRDVRLFRKTLESVLPELRTRP